MAAAARILLVDDDPQLLKTLAMRLSLTGYEVTAVESAERALQELALRQPHLVVTDLKMAGMDGLALFDRVHQMLPALPVIILTAHGTIPDAVRATRRGVFGFLAKPVDAQELVTEVERALAVSGAGEGEGQEEAWCKDIITRSVAMKSILQKAKLAAATEASVLIVGNSGTGKEMLAQAIHRGSARHERPFVALNCGAIPGQLLESELFGHVKGAFTGAVRDHRGLFQSASGGTLFLDEIGDMPSDLQVKLLRVIQERRVRPVGATSTQSVDVRLISATHRDLDAEVKAGKFREDLFYRLNVVKLALPPLSERREDIPLLATCFLREIAARFGKSVGGFAPDALQRIIEHAWPGNVRQLYNVVEQAVALATGAVVDAPLVENALDARGSAIASLDEAKLRFERDYLVQLLKLVGGNVTQAARLAQRNRSEFYNLLGRHQLDPAAFKTAPGK